MSTSTAPLSEIARHVVAPTGIVATGWPSIRATCVHMGLGFDRWQDDLGKLICAKRGDGLYAADMFGMSIPRQTGKTYLLGALVFALCIKQDGATVIWTAHRTRTAAETFKSMQGMAGMEKIAPHIDTVFTGNGKEEIRFVNGSRILFGARERGFGRGFAGVDVLIFDEAQILSENAIDDMVPATNAAPNPLILLAGTPPKPTDPGEVFTMLRHDAITGEVADVGFVEISAERGADLDDRTQWRRMNPSYPHRTSARAILRMRKALSDDSFRREAMGIWDEFTVHQPIVKPARWAELADLGPDPDDLAPPDALAVDMSHARDIGIGACWRMVDGGQDDGYHIEQVWAGADHAAAVEWIVERAGRRIPVLIDNMSPAAALAPILKARKVNVRLTTAGDMARACGLFADSVAGDRLTHGDQDAVNAALAGARKRQIRDAGGWGYDRRDPTSSIYPLVAVTLALLGAAESRRPAGRTRGSAMFA
ncbi:terminase [Mycobacterium phage Aminay]|uniref:Terminase n=1 Tax=Mycobacterium phage Aminay TaxID=2250291 RepID=A0A345KUZ2_9CAUD|nr:terminase [Mycobacterium phage Aminay]AXH46844.1 terminase [Mycobacterium phage Aminay]